MLQKLLSARFWTTVFIVGTVCAGFLMGKVTSEAFIPIAALVVNWYFQRNDRAGK